MKLAIACSLAALVSLFPLTASAQSAADKAAAEQLFEEGRTLMKAKSYDAACAKFEASNKLDPALGTLLNLANCYEESGRLASAWAAYLEAETLAGREGQAKRKRFAADRAKKLSARLPRITVTAADPDLAGLEITRDGLVVGRAQLGSAIPVDPGAHQVVATAPGHERFETEVTVEEGKTVTVEVPPLTRSAAPTPEPGTPEPGVSVPVAPVPGDDGGDPGRTRRILGLSAGGAGVVAVAVGLGFGAVANSNYNEPFDDGLCDRDTLVCSTQQAQDQTEKAATQATVSTVLVAGGVALAAAGAVLYLTAPDGEERPRVSASLGDESFGIVLTGGF